jgi:BioD-like phosphotransacetylase family protein
LLDVPTLVTVWFRNPVSVGDACVAAKQQLGDRLVGILVNGVPAEALEHLNADCRPCLEERGVPILGALPLQDRLQALSVGELADVLEGEFLALPEKEDVLIEQLVVGAMSVEQALPRIRRVPGTKAVITGGDRADIQLVALETSTDCLILTGYLRPVPEVLRRAEEAGVPVLLVRHNTMETVEAIERVFGKTRLGQAAKLDMFERLLDEHFSFGRLYEALGLG